MELNYSYPVYSTFAFGDMTAVFLKCQDGLIFTAIPAGMEKSIPVHRRNLNDTVGYRSNHEHTGNDATVINPECAVQFHVIGDKHAYFLDSMRNGESVQKLKLKSQEKIGNVIFTRFADERGIELEHRVEWREKERFFTVESEVFNHSGKTVEIGMLESASLGMLSPFHAGDAPDALKIYRYLSGWASEAREVVCDPEELNLRVVWSGSGNLTHRFGNRTSMVTREYFPCAGLEDTAAGVSFVMQLATVQPWQMCISRNGDVLTLSGGYPDYDFNHFSRILRSGESLSSFPAVISCVRGSMEQALERVKEYALMRKTVPVPAVDRDLPCIFNEFCTTWGHPTEANLRPVIDSVKGLGFRYFVIDGGWLRPDAAHSCIGDWEPCEAIYPNGFDKLLDTIRDAGMIPGIWFEFECLSRYSKLYREHPDYLVTVRGSHELLNIDRYFLDFRKKAVWDYLDERVIGFLKKHRFGYMKVDYNAQFCEADGENGSLTYGCTEMLKCIRDYFLHIKAELPDLVLEICSSGGMRLSPEWMRIGDMASFSDCHEAVDAPVIAASVGKLIPFRTSQIWATLRKGESGARTVYLLAGGFLGRLCVSGDAASFSGFQREMIRKAVSLYGEHRDVLSAGTGKTELRLTSQNYNDPKGSLIYRRTADAGEMFVLFNFTAGPGRFELPTAFRRISGILASGAECRIENGHLIAENMTDMTAAVVFVR